MKIVILKRNIAYRGGAEKYALRLANAFIEKGCDVTVLTTGSYEDKRINFLSMGPRRSFFSCSNIAAFDRECQRWLKENDWDIVFGMDRNSFQTHYRAGEGVHISYLEQRKKFSSWLKRLSFVFNPLHRRILQMERLTYENPALKVLFTNSEMVRQEILQHYSILPEKIQVVHNGVEWYEMEKHFQRWPQEREDILASLGLDGQRYQFLFVGNGYKRKGLQRIIDALPKGGFQLSVVGKDKEEKFFRTQVAQRGLQDSVKFFGPREDMYDFYKAADCLVIPSYYDPFANVTVEALAMGLFVVSSDANGGYEVLTPETGCVVSGTEDMRASLLKAMKNPKSIFSAQKIRCSVQHLDFSKQLKTIVNSILSS